MENQSLLKTHTPSLMYTVITELTQSANAEMMIVMTILLNNLKTDTDAKLLTQMEINASLKFLKEKES